MSPLQIYLGLVFVFHQLLAGSEQSAAGVARLGPDCYPVNNCSRNDAQECCDADQQETGSGDLAGFWSDTDKDKVEGNASSLAYDEDGEFIPATTNSNQDGLRRASIQSLFGQVAKTVVYGGASLARLNNRLLCPLLTSTYTSLLVAGEQSDADEEQPTLFVFNDHLSEGRAFKIYADDEITSALLGEARFDASQMTFIFVHGWLGGIHNELWLTEAKNALLKSTRDSFRPNAIVVDWSDLASGSLYTATRNSLQVSRRLAKLLSSLVSVAGLRPELMHCLGHSIGTHICGQAARQAFPAQPAGAQLDARRFGRITGLDPGGFCYELNVRNETTYAGLRPSDALLVDAYYTNRSPFGNRFQVAHYNVRINNGFFQAPCSVWYNPETARKYFRASVRFLAGNTGNNELLTCDHYFATKLAEQLLPSQVGSSLASCSFVAYACDSYRSFSRGRCGSCESAGACHSMDFEYQRANASTAHALQYIKRHSSLTSDGWQRQPPGGVEYADRRVFYMRVASETPMCAMTFRVRVGLRPDRISTTFRADWLKVRFTDEQHEQLMFRDASSGKVTDSLALFGPWRSEHLDASGRDEQTGLDESTLTGLFELASAPSSPIRGVQIDCELELGKRFGDDLIEWLKLDYLSSTDERIRSHYSHEFAPHEISIYQKRPKSE